MPRYLTQHTLACLTRQGAEELASQLAAAAEITPRRTLFNMVEGKMVVEFEAPNRETLEGWLKRHNFHFDYMFRIEYEFAEGRLTPV
jgi:hypothetical protein